MPIADRPRWTRVGPFDTSKLISDKSIHKKLQPSLSDMCLKSQILVIQFFFSKHKPNYSKSKRKKKLEKI